MTTKAEIRLILSYCTSNFVSQRHFSSVLYLTPEMANKPKSPTFNYPRHFYRRPLPDQCISFNSEEGKKIFREALLSGHMESYFSLAAQFRTQDEPAFCGLSTLVMVLNTLEVDPWRVWKGPWRWYHEQMLDCCLPLDEVEKKGINLEQFACLATCNTLKVQMVRADNNTSEKDFREIVSSRARQCREVVVASYSRGSIGQMGDGHFSPIGGYHPERDLALILDVARFKYPPHWVSLPLLFKAMQQIDIETGRPRGYFILQKSSHVPLVMFRLSESMSIPVTSEASSTIHQFTHHWNDWLMGQYTGESEADLISKALEVFIEALKFLPDSNAILYTQIDSLKEISQEHFITIKNLITTIEALPLFETLVSVIRKLDADSLNILQRVGLNHALPIPKKLITACARGSSCNGDSTNFTCSCFTVKVEHFVTILFLSWPYCRTGGTVGQAMLKLMTLQNGDGFQSEVLMNEATQLRKQLTSIAGYLQTCEMCVPECNCIIRSREHYTCNEPIAAV